MPGVQEIIVNAVIVLGNIAVMYLILRLLVYKPLRLFMTQRSDKINGQIAQAEKMMAEAREMREDVDRDILDQADNAERLMHASEEKAQQRAADIIAEAQRKAEEIIEEAQRRIENERVIAIDRMRADISDMAIQISAKVLEREVSSADNRHIIEDYFKKVV